MWQRVSTQLGMVQQWKLNSQLLIVGVVRKNV